MTVRCVMVREVAECVTMRCVMVEDVWCEGSG